MASINQSERFLLLKTVVELGCDDYTSRIEELGLKAIGIDILSMAIEKSKI